VVVGEVLEQVAVGMERKPKYFDPQLPATFRFLDEAVKDRRGATKAIVYGAVKSLEDLFSFLGQRSMGLGKKTGDALEQHISKAVAAALITGFGARALQSGALPHGWAWLQASA
jgi:hypothetical protein